MIFKGIQVILPQFVLALAVIIERVPRKNAGIMQVVELEANGVIADRFDLHDADVAAARNDGFLARTMTLNLGRRAFHTQQFSAQGKTLSVLEIDLEDFLIALEADFLGPVLDARRLGLDIGDGVVLERYQRWRRFDNTLMLAMTDGLNKLFSNNIRPLRLVRDLGLAAVNSLPPLKKFFMGHAMGLVGDLPRLMRDQPL